jgi:hypothetical protein
VHHHSILFFIFKPSEALFLQAIQRTGKNHIAQPDSESDACMQEKNAFVKA